MKKNWKNKIPLFMLMGIAGGAAFVGLVMLLWNSTLPAVMHVGMITFWQAAGLLLLARILFGGFKGGRHRFGGGCRNKYDRGRWSKQYCSEPQVVQD